MRGTRKPPGACGEPGAPVNIDELEHVLYEAERRVQGIQTKLHRWARDDPHRRFHDLFNLVADPAFLLVAWARVRGNKGARTAGVDGRTVHAIERWQGVEDSSTSCDPRCGIAVSGRCRCVNG